jgi:SAM-dependent methyltransferase
MSPAAESWWSTFFSGAALEVWRRAHPREENRAEAGDIARILRLERGERVLDVPCGDGRLALELAARELCVRGVDASEELLTEARRCAVERGLPLELLRCDMRELPGHGAFDAAFCVGHSFGYFDDPGNRAFLRAVASALRPGGRFLLECPLVAELALSGKALHGQQRIGSWQLSTDSELDAERRRMETVYTFVDLSRPGSALERRWASCRIYSVAELDRSLVEAGFQDLEHLGGLDETAFAPDSLECYVRARRA